MSAKIVECPRDAMQGLKEFIPTDVKISYLNSLLNCNFHTLDFGSFVSPKAIPQLADTAEVLEGLHMTNTKLLAIVANMRGAEVAIHYNEITYLGFPFSISETFQHRNTNTAQSDAFDLVKQMQELCTKYNKTLVVYISMGFGNPYGDAWNVDIVADWTNKMQALGITIISLADTVGAAQPGDIAYLYKNLIPLYPDVEFGAHFHTTPTNWQDKIDAAWQNGCRRFDGAIKGYGGCPMAANELTGNLATENLLYYLQNNKVETDINMNRFNESMIEADSIFNRYQ